MRRLSRPEIPAGHETENCETPALPKEALMKGIEVGQPMVLLAMDILGPLPMTAYGNLYVHFGNV